jgi:hypothetical protein
MKNLEGWVPTCRYAEHPGSVDVAPLHVTAVSLLLWWNTVPQTAGICTLPCQSGARATENHADAGSNLKL